MRKVIYLKTDTVFDSKKLKRGTSFKVLSDDGYNVECQNKVVGKWVLSKSNFTEKRRDVFLTRGWIAKVFVILFLTLGVFLLVFKLL